ncbi:DUF433 domain-containing protein [Halococcus salifodinae]|jgi:uncharacterized protein (DUF433 family)|uniref:DUF433 domain-containing protein n=1 Tax=Halococcus salifodinae DSM 8989 TaxID=1227456 RepID=M0NAE1_9EURY|nr:DUF433 domain-containing protein [Halococcus salifodinae]EMA54518.1 hypothetical protein C450_05655 [Halococcus salifodinae DSM 8989]
MAQQTARIVKGEDVMGGEPRIEGRRISVRQVAGWVEKGDLSAKTVADRYDLDIADVYRALTYYHENPARWPRCVAAAESRYVPHGNAG